MTFLWSALLTYQILQCGQHIRHDTSLPLPFQKLLIVQIKMVLKVLFLYLPLPMFWTLFDQKVLWAISLISQTITFCKELGY